MYFTVMNTYIRTSHCVPTTIVRTLKRKNKSPKQKKITERRKLKKGKTKQENKHIRTICTFRVPILKCYFHVQYTRCIAG